MAYLCVENEFEGVRKAIALISDRGNRVKRALEICPLFISIPYNQDVFNLFSSNRVAFAEAIGPSGTAARARTDRVYSNEMDRLTKPSYRLRLKSYPDSTSDTVILNNIDQISKIAYDLSLRPRISTLSFTILRPSDLYKNIRPGYVPCPISGDFKYRAGKLNLNVMFRSCDALNFLYHDIYYMRMLQHEVLTLSRKFEDTKICMNSEVGDLNLFLSRAFVQTTESTAKYRGKRLLAEIDRFMASIPISNRAT